MNRGAAFQIGCLLSFLLFLILGFRVALSDASRRRRNVNVLIAYVLAISTFAAITQLDDWPFASYTLAAFNVRTAVPVCLPAYYGVDAQGREWRLDQYTFSPAFSTVVEYWLDAGYPRLPPAQQRHSMAFLLRKAEASRRTLRATGRVGYERLLGPFHLPYWWLLPRTKRVAPTPYRGLRFYKECVRADLPPSDALRRQRTLVVEYFQ